MTTEERLRSLLEADLFRIYDERDFFGGNLQRARKAAEDDAATVLTDALPKLLAVVAALRQTRAAADCVPYHRNPKDGGPCSYPPEGHREYSCPLCIGMTMSDEALAALDEEGKR